MLIVALVLAVVSLAALVTAVVTSNEVIAWICIGLSALGILILIVDAIRDRNRRPAVGASDRTEVLAPVGVAPPAVTEVGAPGVDVSGVDVTEVIEPGDDDIGGPAEAYDADYPDTEVADYPDTDDESILDTLDEQIRVEDHPDEILYDEPDDDTPSDDEAVYPVAAEEAAIHIVTDDEDAQLITDEDALTVTDEDAIADAIESSESSAEPYPDDAATVIVYAGEPYPDEAATVISADEPEEDGSGESDAVTTDEGSTTVVYADETDDSVSDSSDEHGESDAR